MNHMILFSFMGLWSSSILASLTIKEMHSRDIYRYSAEKGFKFNGILPTEKKMSSLEKKLELITPFYNFVSSIIDYKKYIKNKEANHNLMLLNGSLKQMNDLEFDFYIYFRNPETARSIASGKINFYQNPIFIHGDEENCIRYTVNLFNQGITIENSIGVYSLMSDNEQKIIILKRLKTELEKMKNKLPDKKLDATPEINERIKEKDIERKKMFSDVIEYYEKSDLEKGLSLKMNKKNE